MSNLPSVSGKDVVKALEKLGFYLDRVSGSHHVMKKANPGRTAPVPVHGNADLPKGTLRNILKQAGITKDQLINALK